MNPWPILMVVPLAWAAWAAYLLARYRAELRARWVRCAACGQPAPVWRMQGTICRGCVIDAQGVAVLTPDPPTPGRILDVRNDPRLASFWRDVRARESLNGDTPDADALLRRHFPDL